MLGVRDPGAQASGRPMDQIFPGGVVSLVHVYSAYVSEVYRAGIESVHPSQDAAARSLGLTPPVTCFVVIPSGRPAGHPAVAQRLHRAPEGHRARQRSRGRRGAAADADRRGGDAQRDAHRFCGERLPPDHDPPRTLHRLARRARTGASDRRPEVRRRPRLEVEGLHKSGRKLEVLRGRTTSSLEEHEVVCCSGASGSGKSILLAA